MGFEISPFVPSSFTPSFIRAGERSYALHRKIATGVSVPFPFPSQSSFQPSALSPFFFHRPHAGRVKFQERAVSSISAFTFASVPVGLLHHCKEMENRNYIRSTANWDLQAYQWAKRGRGRSGKVGGETFSPALIASRASRAN